MSKATHALRDTDRLQKFDFARHNEEIDVMWAAYRSGRPTRTPIFFGLNTRFLILTKEPNPRKVPFDVYMGSPDAMFDLQLEFQRWTRHNVIMDWPMGLPDAWGIAPDFQNCYEACWFGCKMRFTEDQVPAAHADFRGCPERVMENGLPDPFGGFLAKGLEYYQRYQERAASEEYEGRPIQALPPGYGIGTDGPMTVACNLFGADWVCEAMAAEPERLHVLLDFIMTATIERMKAWRKFHNLPWPVDDFWFADDSIALISTRMYREHILPYHRRLLDEFATPVHRSIHLCGDATRHFPTLKEELGITQFDTGFPVDFGRLRAQLGPEVSIQGGPHVDVLRFGAIEDVRRETLAVLTSGVLEGGLFILREGNNLAPGTPLENCDALYFTGRESGYKSGAAA